MRSSNPTTKRTASRVRTDTVSMTDETIFDIYAAPMADDGRYRVCKDKDLYRKRFKNREQMQTYWDAVVVPNTSTRPGKAYEISRVMSRGAKWKHVGESRYADKHVISGGVTKHRQS